MATVSSVRSSQATPTLLEGGRYEVKHRLGSGTFKTVWLAKDRLQNEDIALAVIRTPHDEQVANKFRDSFWNEAQLLFSLTRDLPPSLAPLTHRIVEYANFGELKEEEPFQGLYLATRFVPGRTLRQSIKTDPPPWPWHRIRRLAIGMLEALEVSHTPTALRGPVLHRDIKPANIIVSDDDEVTVLDFGIARVMEATQIEQSAMSGTLQYMAPEQMQAGMLIGPGTDLFAIAVILHELSTGRPPWSRKNIVRALDFVEQGRLGQVPPLNALAVAAIPPKAKAVIRSALDFELANRPFSATDMKQALVRANDDYDVELESATLSTAFPSGDPTTIPNTPLVDAVSTLRNQGTDTKQAVVMFALTILMLTYLWILWTIGEDRLRMWMGN